MTARHIVLALVALALGWTVQPALAYTKDDTAKTATTDGTVSDTQSAINYADARNEDGWIITIGTSGGSYTWTTTLSVPDTYTNTLTLQSAGAPSTLTTLTMNFTDGGSALYIRGTNNKLQRLTGFRFLTQGSNTFGTGVVNVDKTGTTDAENSFRIDNCRFENCANYGIGVMWADRTAGAIHGLIDNVVFANTGGRSCVYLRSGSPSGADTDIGEWSKSMTWGTAATIVLEDCTFSTDAIVEGLPAVDGSHYGVRYMVRHCAFTNYVVVAHGADSAKSSTLQVELLHNTFLFNETSKAFDFVIYLRGGTARVWDNTVTFANGAVANQIIKTAIDTHASRTLGFQQPGHGASSGTEVVSPIYVWGNSVPSTSYGLLNGPNDPNQNGVSITGMFVLNTHYFLSDPGNYSELAYPHPLRGSSNSNPSMGPRSSGNVHSRRR